MYVHIILSVSLQLVQSRECLNVVSHKLSFFLGDIAYPVRGPVTNVHKSIISVNPSQIVNVVVEGVTVDITNKLVPFPSELVFDGLDAQLTFTNDDAVTQGEGKPLDRHNQEKVDISPELYCVVIF